MKTKNLLLWLTAFVVAAAVITSAGILRAKRPSEKSMQFIPGFSPDKCSMVLIADKADTVRIKRSGETWVVAGKGGQQAPAGGLAGLDQQPVEASGAAVERDYAVDSASLAAMLEKLQAMKKDELVSQNPQKQAVFEVDTAAGLLVQVWDDKGKQVATFRIGKNGPGYSSHYVRADGSDDVYAVQGSIKYSFFADRKRWCDKTVVKFPKNSVKTISLAKKGGASIVLDKSTDSTGAASWKMIAPEQSPAATDKVDDILEAMARLTCLDWETGALADTAMGLATPELIATATVEGGVEHKVLVGRKIGNDAKYWVRTPDMPGQTFQVSSYAIERLDKNVDVLKAAPAAAPAAGAGAAAQ